MTPEEFRSLCNDIGLEAEQRMDPSELPDDAERVPLLAENDNGDCINYHIGLKSDEWIVSFDLEGYTLDSNEFSKHDIETVGDELVISGVSGTRPSSGYGVSGFTDGEIRVGKDGASLLERH